METTTDQDTIPLDLISFAHGQANTALATLTLLLGVAILALNVLLCAFYYSRNTVIFDKLFLLLSTVDAATGVVALLQSATLVAILSGDKTAVTGLLTVGYLLSAVSFHVSAFYNILLAVCRTIALIRPFYSFRLQILYTIAGVYPCLMSILAVYEVSSVYLNYPALVDRIMFLFIAPLCGSELIYNHNSEFSDLGYYIILLGIPFVLPSIICFACCLMVLVSLRNNSKQNTGTILSKKSNNHVVEVNNYRKKNKRATVTILLLSITFFICNTLYFTTEFTLQAVDPQQLPSEMYLVYIAGNLLPFLNSLINPAILIARGSNLRDFIRKTGKKVLLMSQTRTS